MDEQDHQTIADMVRESAAYNAASGRASSLAKAVRITETSKPAPHKHTPIDFNRITAEKAAARAKAAEQQEADLTKNPTLSFVSANTDEKPPVMSVPGAPAVKSESQVTVIAQASSPRIESLKVSVPDYVHVADLPGGVPMFTYKGVLMAGYEVKGVQI